MLSRQQLEEKLYSWRDEVSSNAVEVYIHGVRKKLGAELIQNVRGLGYLVPAQEMARPTAAPGHPGALADQAAAQPDRPAAAGQAGVGEAEHPKHR